MALPVTIIGAGYLGVTHAACLAELGHEVLAIDTAAERVRQLTAGRLPFYEPGLEPLLRSHLESGRLRFTTSYDQIAEFGDVHFICVGTPQQPNSHAADLRDLDSVIDTLAPRLHRGCLVVGKSTVPVGTAERVASRLSELAPAGPDVDLAWSPEFLREGHAVADTLRPDRLVVGVQTPRSEQLLREVYAPLLAAAVPWITTDLATAQLVKESANAFLATKISFINAMAELCDASGADVSVLAQAIGLDDRIGPRYLRAGLGFGGGCLPKDIRALMARAGELGVDEALTFLKEVDAINQRRRRHVVELTNRVLGGSARDRRIAVLGAAFKPDNDDVRDSPALDVAAALSVQGADVQVHDPKAIPHAQQAYPSLSYAPTAEAALTGADALLVLTEWEEYRTLDPSWAAALVNQRVVVDGRLCLDPEVWAAAGWSYYAPGRPNAGSPG